MLNTKYVLMFVVLSAGMLTALTGTGILQAQTALASDDEERVCENNNDNNCNDVKQKVDQENKCKIENENENKRHSDNNNNYIQGLLPGLNPDKEVNCWNHAQNAGQDASAQGDAFSAQNDGLVGIPGIPG